MTATKNPKLPRLRFPEFNEDKGWSYHQGNDVFDQISDKQHNSDLPILAITQDQGAIPRDEIDYNVVVTEKSIESYKVVQVGDFIISLRSFQGGIEYSNFKGICSPAYVILRKKIDVASDFFKHYFKTPNFIQKLNKNIEGLRDGKMVSYKQFSELLLPRPHFSEQQKIADCLSSLDDLIAAEREKLDALKAHKKGLMQQLFPAEGETVPMRRFPEFEGEWSETILEDNYNLLSGQHLNPDEYSTIERNQYPYFSGPSDFTNDLNSVTKWAIVEGKRALRGSILITVKGSGVGASMLLSLTEVVIGRQLMAISSNTASVPFLFHQIGNWTGYYQALAAGNMIPGLSRVDILRSPIKIPSMAEQEKISAVLTAVDERITAQAEKIDQLKIHKKGLMQQLFPSEL